MLAYLWNDPVWNKVIAGIILLVVTAAGARIANIHWWSAIMRWVFRVLSRRYRPAANIRVIDARPEEAGIGYPLKYRITMLNNTAVAAEVRVAEYRPKRVTLKRLVLEVLQLWFGEWLPDRDGVDRIAVYPQQQFRAWIGIDESKFNAQQVEALRGQIGTLVLSIDGEAVSIDL